MIVTGTLPISSSSGPQAADGSTIAATEGGEVDFGGLLFLMLGGSQPGAGVVPGALVAETPANVPASAEEAIAADGEAETSEDCQGAESAGAMQLEPGFIALQTALVTPSATGDPSETGIHIAAVDAQASAAFSQDAGGIQDTADQTSNENGNQPIDIKPAESGVSAEAPEGHFSEANPLLPAASGRAAQRIEQPAQRIERPDNESKKNSGAAVSVPTATITERQVAPEEITASQSETPAASNPSEAGGEVQNPFGRVMPDRSPDGGGNNQPGFNFAKNTHPQELNGAGGAEKGSGFIISESPIPEAAASRREPATRSDTMPLTPPRMAAHEVIQAPAGAAREWRPVIDQVASGIAGHLRINRNEAVIQLDPPDLGKIKIDLHLSGDKLQARIVAEASESHSLIENHLHELRQALQAQSVDVVDVRVSHGGLNGGGDPAANFRQSSNGRQDSAFGATNPQPASDRGETRNHDGAVRTQGRVSVWA
jgi:flagellar hook-length control protein FliK